MDLEKQRLFSPYRAPTIAERKKWLLMAQEKQPAPHQGEDLTNQSPSLNKLRLSTAAKVRLTPQLFRRKKKMNKKPPIPEKSERIKSIPVARPRKIAPPPKPQPYNVHRSEIAKKPNPVPRKVSQEGNGVPAPTIDHQTQTGSVETQNTTEESPTPHPAHPRGKISKPGLPAAQSVGITSRPRVDAPVTPPDPEVAHRNGVLSSPVPAAWAGAPAAPPPTRPRPSLPENRKTSSASPVNGRGKLPLPPPPGDLGHLRGSEGDTGVLDTSGGEGVSEKPGDETENDLYSTITDSPRIVRTPTPSRTPPTPLSRSMTPPVPLPRSSHTGSPIPASSPSSEYSVTSHKNTELRSHSPLVAEPTPPDTYSALARPDQPNKPLNPAPSGEVGQMYSSLELEGIQQVTPPVKPAYLDEGYSHLEFDGVTVTTVAEHYEMNTSPVDTEDLVRNVRRATNPERMGLYEEVSPQDENDSTLTGEQTHRPLSITRSAPLEPQIVSRAKPKVVPRQLSDKNLELRDQSSLGMVDDVTSKVVGAVKLAPAPAPRTWKKTRTVNSIGANGQDDNCRGAFGDVQGQSMEDDDFYTIPPDAENTPEPSPSIHEMMEATETKPLGSVPLGFSITVDEGKQVVPPEPHGKTDTDLDDSMVVPDAVEDGRGSSSSFLRECLNEFAKKSNELHSNSPIHVMVNIDHISQQRDTGRSEGEQHGEEDMAGDGDVEEQKIRRHSYENQEIVDQNKDGTREAAVHCEGSTINNLEESTEGALVEDLSQYCLQTVRKPDIEVDAQGYCTVEMSANEGQCFSLVEEVLNQFESATLSDLPPLPLDDDITNYDMKTVEHPPVTTNAQGYSYCDVGLRSPSELTSGGAGFSASTSAGQQATSGLPLGGYAEVGAPSSRAKEPLSAEQGRHRPPEPAPKPQRRKGEAFKPGSNDANKEVSNGEEVVEGISHGTMEEETKTELSDTDSLYARIADVKIKKEAGNKRNSPKPSPKPKRNKQVPGSVGKPTAKRKGHGPPRRRPPPPPPPGARIPSSAPLPQTTLDAPPTLPPSVPCLKKIPREPNSEHRFEQTLPPFSSYQPSSSSGSPLHQRSPVADDPLTLSLPPLPPSLGSPKLPGRRGPLPPSPTASSSQAVDPPSPIHRRGLLNRIKSSSLKSRKSENHSPTTVSPLLTDEVGRVGDQSPKVGWKNKFRFRRGSGNSAAAMESSVDGGYPEEYGGEACGFGGAGIGESRRRRNQEDKLPEVPHATKSRSLPSPARRVGRGIHMHPYEGEEEEMEDGLYSVVNKPAKTLQPPAAAIRAEATKRQSDDRAVNASKAYEVVIPPSVVRPRTGSRSKNDVMRRSNSVEHLEQEGLPDFNEVEEGEERVVKLGSHSATSSPVLPRRRAQRDGAAGGLDSRGFHLGTLPRKKPAVPPPTKTRHVYATVSKSEEAAALKGSPPSTLPKPKRGGGGGESESSLARDTKPRPDGASAPMLEVFKPLDDLVARTIDDESSDVTLPGTDSTDKPRDEDLQGLPSSEIAHERAEDGHIYAVVNKKSKKKGKKKTEHVEKTEDGALEAPPVTITLDVGEVGGAMQPKPPATKPPPKPPRGVKPPKPAPYVPRVGSPIPAILAAAAAECSSPLPPLSPSSHSPPSVPDRLPARSFEEAPKSPLPLSPHIASPFATVPPDVEQQRARLSMVGPPSFPPPPPPQDPSSPPPLDHTYETPPILLKSKSTEEAPRARKEPVKPLPTATFATDGDVEDEITPGYDVIARPKRNRDKSGKKGSGANGKKLPPVKQRSFPEYSSERLQPPSSACALYKDENAKSARTTCISRSPHLYEAVSDDFVVENSPLSAESAHPSKVAVHRPSHIYESPDDVRKQVRPKGTAKKRPPPPAPPTSAAKPDNAPPIVTTETTDGTDPPNGPISRNSQNSDSNMASPVAEIVSNPLSYLGANMAGKRLTVDIQYNVDEEEERESNEPKFLFNKGRLSHFIPVGQDKSETVALSPCHSSTTQSSSSVSVFEDDSDADIMYSTDWESSSGEEDEEEYEEEEEGEGGRVIEHRPARTKTFYIAQEILTTERTYVKGLKLIDRDFRSTILSANRSHDKPVLSEDTLKLILGNVSSILSLNSGMLAELEERMKIWDTDPRIGDIILNRAPYLKIYSEYISRFDKALKTLEESTKKNLQFARVLREFEAQPSCAQLPLAGYMLETVQRIPRYKLLLTDYVKHLPENSPDRAPSERALGIISSVAIHVNETIRQMDNFRKVMEVRKKIIGDTGDTLITPYRKLLKEGLLLKFSRKEPQPRMFFLFNDILIYASSIPPTNTTFKVIKRIPLEGMRVEMLNDPDMRHGFQIISTCKSFRLEASSNEDLHQWMSAFDTAIKEHREKTQSRKSIREQLNPDGGEEERIPLGHLAPPWLPDSAVSMCQLCSVQFTVTRRRHHCRACGQIFCSDCSSYLAPLRYKSDKLGRVCQSCYEGINGEGGATDDRTLKRAVGGRSVKALKINLPSVLREVKARDQNVQISGYLLSHATRSRRWKKKWFIVYNLVLYEFEKHEDVTAKCSVVLPSYQIDTTHRQDPLVFCLKHPGTGKLYFKAETEEQRDRWLEVLEKAVKGEISSSQDQQMALTPIRAPSPQPDDANL